MSSASGPLPSTGPNITDVIAVTAPPPYGTLHVSFYHPTHTLFIANDAASDLSAKLTGAAEGTAHRARLQTAFSNLTEFAKNSLVNHTGAGVIPDTPIGVTAYDISQVHQYYPDEDLTSAVFSGQADQATSVAPHSAPAQNLTVYMNSVATPGDNPFLLTVDDPQRHSGFSASNVTWNGHIARVVVAAGSPDTYVFNNFLMAHALGVAEDDIVSGNYTLAPYDAHMMTSDGVSLAQHANTLFEILSRNDESGIVRPILQRTQRLQLRPIQLFDDHKREAVVSNLAEGGETAA
ncbi:uncharacterized protein MKK02DRAFT_42746 [Dioszegia hungarica]|uniref:Uncharacterized protein n=1 Tax=Dioszegia hungarica TaxID=4972 RepID=A0AA38HEY9_9TREE|nr:uncharacterized protein MKK02DRAFT_42746 [Dioszegia hungarica]KAI9638359.1 hypothetical protein MKK02DRAFT_42746 [Dioszegia hungarica]